MSLTHQPPREADHLPTAADTILTDQAIRQSFELRLAHYATELRESLATVYGDRAEVTYQRIVDLLARIITQRPAELRRLDEERLLASDWLQKPEMIGYVTYVDRFAENLTTMTDHLDHLTMLGVRTLHLMPLLAPRPGESDGGYAVADYRRVREDLGTMDDLAALARKLRTHGISLELDLVLNHVAAEHEWARRARAGEQKYRDYFYIYPDRTMPDDWEASLPEVFPDFAPGNFTWDDELAGWVWTTFNAYQWDVNWSNPDVLLEYLDILGFRPIVGWRSSAWMPSPSSSNGWAPTARTSPRCIT